MLHDQTLPFYSQYQQLYTFFLDRINELDQFSTDTEWIEEEGNEYEEAHKSLCAFLMKENILPIC